MGMNRAFDRPLFVMEGAVKKSGGSLELEKGELALVDNSKSGNEGLKVITSAAGIPKDRKVLELRLGVAERGVSRSHTNKAESTIPFSLEEVIGLKVSAPKLTEQSLDEFTLGYDGINAETAFNFRTGDAYFRMYLELSGGAIEYRGSAGGTERIGVDVAIPHCSSLDDCVDCDGCEELDCKSITLEAIERLRRKQLSGGKKVEDFVDITPIFSCDNAANPDEIAYNFYCLEVCDTGGEGAKAAVSAQYNTKVERIDRKGAISKYQILLPASEGTPAVYSQKLPSLIKGCDTCPTGYTASPEGILYAITIEDNGDDISAAIVTAVPGIVTGTVIKSGNDNGVGFYTFIVDNSLTDAEVDTLLASSDTFYTATFRNLGKVEAICTNPTVTTKAWVVCGSCNVITEQYKITLPDTKCGNNRLAELNERYQGLTVELLESGNATRTVGLTGTAGTLTFNFVGATLTTTFSGDVESTLNSFVATNAIVFANEGVIVTVSADGDALIFTGTEALVNSIVITSSGAPADWTITTITEPIPVSGGCRTSYVTTVISNMVCDECDDIYKDFYKTKAPESFDTHLWEKIDKVSNLPTGDCLCGIRFKSKPFVLASEEALRDIVQFTETSALIRGAAGYPMEIREAIGRLPQGVYEPNYLSRWTPRTHLAGNLQDLEKEGRAFYRGLAYRGKYLGRVLRGETSNMEDPLKQYVQYTLQVHHKKHAGSFAGTANDHINYTLFVEVGKHKDVENILNSIAANAGKTGVSAFGV